MKKNIFIMLLSLFIIIFNYSEENNKKGNNNENLLKEKKEIVIVDGKHFNKNSILLRTDKDFNLAFSSFPDIQEWYKSQTVKIEKIEQPLLITGNIFFTLSPVILSADLIFIILYNNKINMNLGDHDFFKLSVSLLAAGLSCLCFPVLFYIPAIIYGYYARKKAREKAVDDYNQRLKENSFKYFYDYDFILGFNFNKEAIIGINIKI